MGFFSRFFGKPQTPPEELQRRDEYIRVLEHQNKVREEYIKDQSNRIKQLEHTLKKGPAPDPAAPAAASPPPTVPMATRPPDTARLEQELRTREEQLRRKEIEARLRMWEEEARLQQAHEKRRRELALAEERIRRMEAELAQVAAGPGESDRVAKLEVLLREKEEEITTLRSDMSGIQARSSELAIQDLPGPLTSYTFANYVVGNSNRFAYDVCQAVARAPAEAYNPLFLWSNVGLGKTHLMCSVGNEVLQSRPGSKVAYVTSEEFTNELLKAVETNQLETFRRRFRSVDVLCIDDIQFLAGKESTQEEFFNTFNALFNNGRQIVMTSDRPPKDIETLESRLRSRFEGGLIVEIKRPELATRSAILRRAIKRKGVQIPDDVVFFLANKVKSNNRTLIGALNRICAAAETEGPITIATVSGILQDLEVDEVR